jgi:hypothetical protein
MAGSAPGKPAFPESHGETVITRYTLRELLDKLDELTLGNDG